MTAPDFRIRNRAELVDALSVAAQGRHTSPPPTHDSRQERAWTACASPACSGFAARGRG